MDFLQTLLYPIKLGEAWVMYGWHWLFDAIGLPTGWAWALSIVGLTVVVRVLLIPLFAQHRILSQVAGHGLNVIKAIPPLTLSEADVDEFADALDAVLAEAERIPRAAARFALKLASAAVATR